MLGVIKILINKLCKTLTVAGKLQKQSRIRSNKQSQRNERGWLLCLTIPVSSLGLLIMYCSREPLPWHCSAAASAPLSAVMSVVMLFYCADADLGDLETMLQHSECKLSVVECVSDILSTKESFVHG